MSYSIRITAQADSIHAPTLVAWYLESSRERGTGIATRTEAYLIRKITSGDAVIALNGSELIGFCYVETFENKKYVSNSGLIIKKNYRGQGLSTKVKHAAFQLARNKYPDAKIFGITTSDIVMGINTKLGYQPVAFSNLTSDIVFWNGCASCPNYDILLRKDKKMCLCTGMLAPSKNEYLQQSTQTKKDNNSHE